MSCCGCAGGGGAGLGMDKIGSWNFSGGNFTAPPNDGMVALTAAGTATLRAVAATDILTASRRTAYVSAAAINSVAGIRTAQAQVVQVSSSLGLGRFKGAGFSMLMQVAISDAVLNAEARMFLGLRASVAAPAAADPASLVESIGFGCDSGDTTLRLYARDAAANAQEIDLGASFPVNATGVNQFWRLFLRCRPGQVAGAVQIEWQAERLRTGARASGVVTGVAMPTATTILGIQMWRATGAVDAAATGLDVGIVRLDSEL